MYYVYIMTNKNNKVLYTGVTNDLQRRIYEHKAHVDPFSFTAKYKLYKLIYCEEHSNVNDAIIREKQIKNLVRRKKEDLINSLNPAWKDLSEE